MDLSFGDFAQHKLRAGSAAAPLRLDFPRLIAILASIQGASRTAQVAGWLPQADAAGRNQAGSLVAILDPQADWMVAAAAQRWSFNPKVADRIA